MILTAWLLAASAGEPALDAVVLVRQGSSSCAGAFVGEGPMVLTAYHCVASGGRPAIVGHGGQRWKGRVASVNRGLDLALLTVQGDGVPAGLPVEAVPPEQGAEVRVLGHPFGSRKPAGFMAGTLRWSLADGVVSAVGPYALQVTAPVNPGNSGGPVIDEEGRVVGVVSRRLKGDGLGFAGRTDGVTAWIAEHRPWSPLGGTFGADVFLSSWGGKSGTVAAGARVELSFRDRVVVRALASQALTSRWDAVRYGEVSWAVAEAHLAVRQRIGRGPWTGKVELYGGGGALQTVRGNRDLELERSWTPAPLFGGGVGFGNVGLDVAVAPTEGRWPMRGMLTFRWPGLLTVF